MSEEPGFKEEDVKDFKTYGPVPLEDRKDSMVNYLANSIDSSRRGSRPSNAVSELMQDGRPSLPNINEESYTPSTQERVLTVLSGKTIKVTSFYKSRPKAHVSPIKGQLRLAVMVGFRPCEFTYLCNYAFSPLLFNSLLSCALVYRNHS